MDYALYNVLSITAMKCYEGCRSRGRDFQPGDYGSLCRGGGISAGLGGWVGTEDVGPGGGHSERAQRKSVKLWRRNRGLQVVPFPWPEENGR